MIPSDPGLASLLHSHKTASVIDPLTVLAVVSVTFSETSSLMISEVMLSRVILVPTDVLKMI